MALLVVRLSGEGGHRVEEEVRDDDEGSLPSPLSRTDTDDVDAHLDEEGFMKATLAIPEDVEGEDSTAARDLPGAAPSVTDDEDDDDGSALGDAILHAS